MGILKNKVLFAVALGHFAVDTLSGLATVLVTFLSVPLGLSNAQIGFAATLYVVTGSLSQPYFGHLADRQGGRRLAVIGLCWVVFWLSMAAFVPGYPLLAACLGIAGLGSGAFHPQGAMNAFLASGDRRGSGLSIWYVGGALGYALGPALAGLIFQWVGQKGILLLSLPLLPTAFVLARNLPGARASASHPVPADSTPRPGTKRQVAADFLRGRLALSPWILLPFLFLVISRSWVSVGINTYVPKLYAGWGYTPAEYGSLLSLILFADALGGFTGGFLSDRLGKRAVVASSLFCAMPTLLLFFLLPRPWNVLFGILGGFALNASQSVTLLIGQELMPRRVGLASGLIMGFTFVAGALAASASGVLADRIGLLATMRWIALLPLIGAICALALPAHRSRPPSA